VYVKKKMDCHHKKIKNNSSRQSDVSLTSVVIRQFHPTMDMLMSMEDQFTEIFDRLTRVGPVPYVQFISSVADVSDAEKYPLGRRPPKPGGKDTYAAGSDWAKTDSLWGSVVQWTRDSVESRMLGYVPPHVFPEKGSTSKGGIVEDPLEDLMIDYHGIWSHQ